MGYIIESFWVLCEEAGEIYMRSGLRCLGLAAIIFLVVFLPVQPAGAQVLPSGIVVDSALRIDFLFGNQVFGRELPSWEGPNLLLGAHHENIRMDLTTRMPVIEGMVEFTLNRFVSARGSGISGFLTGDLAATLVSGVDVYQLSRDLRVDSATVRPQYHSWEAAALLHLYADGSYRFSILGGYRQDYWSYGVLDGGQNNNTLEYRHNSRIPFFGLQTAMSFPWWKARMEILGSPFSTKVIFLKANFLDEAIRNTLNIDGTWGKGGLIEVRLEGSTYVSSSVTLGVSARYSYEEFRGSVEGYWDRPTPPSLPWPYDFYTMQNLAYIGLNAGFIF